MKCVALKDMFNCLFELSTNKMYTVAEMEHLWWVRVERVGSDVGGYRLGRRSN